LLQKKKDLGRAVSQLKVRLMCWILIRQINRQLKGMDNAVLRQNSRK
jgi:hypothetical protein